MKLSDYVRIARRNIALLVVITLVGTAVGLVASLVQQSRYQATATVYVSTQQATNLNDLAAGANFAQQVVRTYADIVPTALVLDPVIKDLGLPETSQTLAKDVAVSTPIDTVLLDITVTDPSPSRAASIANGIVSSLADTVDVLTPPTADSVAPVRITTVEPAVVPTAPALPNTRMNVLIGLVVGLVLAVLVVLLRQALTQRTPGDEDDASPRRSAAEIGRFTRRSKRRSGLGDALSDQV